MPRLDAPRVLDILSLDGWREPLSAELPLLLLRLVADWLRVPLGRALLVSRLRFALDGRDDAALRSLACVPVPRLAALLEEWPRA